LILFILKWYKIAIHVAVQVPNMWLADDTVFYRALFRVKQMSWCFIQALQHLGYYLVNERENFFTIF